MLLIYCHSATQHMATFNGLSQGDLIMLGKFSCSETIDISSRFTEHFFENLQQQGINDFHETFESCKSSQDQVTLVLKYFVWIDSPQEEFDGNCKILHFFINDIWL